uniref:Uncharacterized protein n=1 Tax=Felis catus TaxID=9685 RepID=A0ABI7YAS0_FELCA
VGEGEEQHAGTGVAQFRDGGEGAEQERGDAQEAPRHPDERAGGPRPPPAPPPPAGHGVHQHPVAVLADVGLDDPVDDAAEEGSERPAEPVRDVLRPEGQAQDEHQVGGGQVGQVDLRHVQAPPGQEEDGQHKQVSQQAAGADGEDEFRQQSVQQVPGLPSVVTGRGVCGRGLAPVQGQELQEGPGRHPRRPATTSMRHHLGEAASHNPRPGCSPPPALDKKAVSARGRTCSLTYGPRLRLAEREIAAVCSLWGEVCHPLGCRKRLGL